MSLNWISKIEEQLLRAYCPNIYTVLLRHAFASQQHKKWFRLSRFEAMPPTLPNQGFESFVTVQLGLCWDPETQMPTWMKGKIFLTPDVLIKLSLEPSLFLNEAFLTISLKVSKISSIHLDWLQVITFCH